MNPPVDGSPHPPRTTQSLKNCSRYDVLAPPSKNTLLRNLNDASKNGKLQKKLMMKQCNSTTPGAIGPWVAVVDKTSSLKLAGFGVNMINLETKVLWSDYYLVQGLKPGQKDLWKMSKCARNLKEGQVCRSTDNLDMSCVVMLARGK